MDTQEYLDLVEGGVGNFTVEFHSDPKPAARHADKRLRKVTTALVMTGAEFSALRENKDRDTGPLPWGTWKVAPYVVEHRGQDYARLYCVDNSLRCIYTVDGEVVDRETFNGYLTPSAAAAKRPVGGCITVKMEGIRLVGEPSFHH
jgi:hypothetical protein